MFFSEYRPPIPEEASSTQHYWKANVGLATGPRFESITDTIVNATKAAHLTWEDPAILSADLNAGKSDDLFKLMYVLWGFPGSKG
jgi:hypothetical protein